MPADLETRLRALMHDVPPPADDVATRVLKSALEATPAPTGTTRDRGRQRLRWLMPAAGIALLAGVLAVLLVQTDPSQPPRTPASDRTVTTGPAPLFRPAPGWRAWATGPTPTPQAPITVTANRLVLFPFDRGKATSDLRLRDIVISATLFERDNGGPPPPSPDAPLSLDRAERGVLQGWSRPAYLLRANVAGDTVEFFVFFGRDVPTAEERAAAEAALARLTVRKATVPGPGLTQLDRPANAVDRKVAAEPWLETTALRAETVRVAGRLAEATWGVGRTPDDRVCLIERRSPRIQSICARDVDLVGPYVLARSFDRPGTNRVVLAGLAPDGVRAARVGERQVPVVDNAFILDLPTPGDIEVLTDFGWITPAQSPLYSYATGLSVLDQPRRAVDSLPVAVLEPPARILPGIGDPAMARRALGTSGGEAFWLVPGDGIGMMCIVAAPDQTGCANIGLLELHGALAFPSSDARGSSWWRYFAAIVPDGYDVASVGLNGAPTYTMPVSGNVAYFPNVTPGQADGWTLVLTGPAGRREVAL